jgi:hypothetical protein
MAIRIGICQAFLATSSSTAKSPERIPFHRVRSSSLPNFPYPVKALGLLGGCPGRAPPAPLYGSGKVLFDPRGTVPLDCGLNGRLVQRESACLTRRMSGVRIPHRPPKGWMGRGGEGESGRKSQGFPSNPPCPFTRPLQTSAFSRKLSAVLNPMLGSDAPQAVWYQTLKARQNVVTRQNRPV